MEGDSRARVIPKVDDIRKNFPGSVGICSELDDQFGIAFHEMFLEVDVVRGRGITPATRAHKFGLVYKGNMQGEQSINRGAWRKQSFSNSDIYITPGGDELRWAGSEVTKQELICLGFHLAPALFEKVLTEVFDKESITRPLQLENGVHDPLLQQLTLSIYREFKECRENGDVYLEASAQFLITHILHQQNKRKLPLKRPSGVFAKHHKSRILNYIGDHLSEQISIARLAAFANMSVYHFSHVFKRTIGQSPHQYIIALRMQRAETLLNNTDIPISTISSDVGYEGIAAFSAAFKRYKGCSPKQFRAGTR